MIFEIVCASQYINAFVLPIPLLIIIDTINYHFLLIFESNRSEQMEYIALLRIINNN
jgi:hypothetical protein